VAARYSAGAADTVVGGDWYDVIAMGGGRLAVVIGDVMGRGVPAAAVMGQLRTAARTCAKLDLRPADVADVLDGLLVDLDQDSIATCIYGAFDPHTRELRVASAGHPPPVLRSPDGSVRTLDLDVSAPLGIGDAKREVSVQLPPGSVLALYTDGLIEARGSDLGSGIAALLPGGGRRTPGARGAGGRRDGDGAGQRRRRRAAAAEGAGGRRRALPHRFGAGAAEALGRCRRCATHSSRRCGPGRSPTTSSDTGTLLASELATNALVHGIGGRGAAAAPEPGPPAARVAGRRPPHAAPPTGRGGRRGGRGLQLVAALAHRWGFRPSDDGKVVWVEFDLCGE
jgi:hypothetical protein